jgi:hypothetical protein
VTNTGQRDKEAIVLMNSKNVHKIMSVEEYANLPPPSADERVAIRKARENNARRRSAVELGLRQKGKNCFVSELPHSDLKGWRDRLRSDHFVSAEPARLATMFRGKNGQVELEAVEAALAVLDGGEPKNEVEAMLLIQWQPPTRLR